MSSASKNSLRSGDRRRAEINNKEKQSDQNQFRDSLEGGESPSEESIQRFYVESPVFTKEDEETIQYVNPDIDEELFNRVNITDPQSVNENPTVYDLAKKTAILKGEPIPPEPKPDMSVNTSKSIKAQDRTWNTLGKKYEQTHSSRDNHDTSGKIIKPITNPLQPLTKEQTEELRLLEEEERYQEELRRRIIEGAKESVSVHIPRLNLDEVGYVITQLSYFL
jgi:hypothetical protein